MLKIDLQRAKLRISERKAKEKRIFLLLYRAKVTSAQARVSNKRAKSVTFQKNLVSFLKNLVSFLKNLVSFLKARGMYIF